MNSTLAGVAVILNSSRLKSQFNNYFFLLHREFSSTLHFIGDEIRKYQGYQPTKITLEGQISLKELVFPSLGSSGTPCQFMSLGVGQKDGTFDRRDFWSFESSLFVRLIGSRSGALIGSSAVGSLGDSFS